MICKMRKVEIMYVFITFGMEIFLSTDVTLHNDKKIFIIISFDLSTIRDMIIIDFAKLNSYS